MHISVDQDRCEGHGLCQAHAPDVFALDDDGVVVYRFDGLELPHELEAKAAAAAGVCPVAALVARR